MSGATLSVKIEDLGAQEAIERLAERTSELTPAMKIVGEIVRASVIKNFESGGRPPWKPLKAISYHLGYTMGRKRKPFTKQGKFTEGFRRYLAGKKILIGQGFAGGLLGSINSRAYPDRAEVGTPKIYGAIHQFGGQAGRGKKVNIPARPYLMVQDEDWPEIRTAIQKYLTRG